MLGGLQRVEDSCGVEAGWRICEWRRRGWDKMSGVGASQMIFPLQVGLGDLKIMQGHVGTFVAEQLHDGGQGDAGAEHLRGICVSNLVWDDAVVIPAAAAHPEVRRGVCGATCIVPRDPGQKQPSGAGEHPVGA